MKIYIFLFLSFAYWNWSPNMPTTKYQVEDFTGSVMINRQAAVKGQVFNSLADIDLLSCNSSLRIRNLLTNKTISFIGNCSNIFKVPKPSLTNSFDKAFEYLTPYSSSIVVTISGADQSELDEYYKAKSGRSRECSMKCVKN